MKKVRFDTSGSIALQLKLDRPLTLEQRTPRKIEGWLIGDHICVQTPVQSTVAGVFRFTHGATG